LAHDGPTTFEEKSLTLHHTRYNKEAKKLQIKKINIKNKKVIEKWSSEVDVIGLGPSRIFKLHLITNDVLAYSITEQ
jgi:hypothetical protein